MTTTPATASRLGHNGGLPIDKAPARKRGRPSAYTLTIAGPLFDKLAAGKSLKAICRQPGMPSERAVLAWVRAKPEFRRQYDLARELGRHTIGDDVLDIVDGIWRRNSPDALNDARREIDAKKWYLARMTPKRRGPRFVMDCPSTFGMLET
jgi:hypothetical protein